MIRRLVTVLALLAIAVLAAPVQAQLRSIPETVQYGILSHLSGMVVELNARAVQLAPGAQIRNAENRIVLPTALAPRSEVLFTLNSDGMIDRVWLPSEAERARFQLPPPSR